MDIIGTSVGVKLARSADDVISIASQEKGFAAGLMNEFTGILDGGLTTSVGLSNTVATVAKVAAGTKFADTIRELPLVGEFLQ